MATEIIVCPGCGEGVEIDTAREFNFCRFCGIKIATADIAEIKNEAKEAKEGMARFVLDPNGCKSKFYVMMDGEVLYQFKENVPASLETTAGTHIFTVRYGLEGSKKRPIEVADGDRLYVKHEGLKGYNVYKA